jgi:L-rhamnose mutarotase
MKPGILSLIGACLALPVLAIRGGRRPAHVRRVGMVIGMRPDRIQAYEALHDASNAGVRDLLTKYNMRNFSIFLKELEDGRFYLFGYYEYTGSDFENDMKKLAAEPRNQQWLHTTDPMQIPLSGERSWATMREVYHNP